MARRKKTRRTKTRTKTRIKKIGFKIRRDSPLAYGGKIRKGVYRYVLK